MKSQLIVIENDADLQVAEDFASSLMESQEPRDLAVLSAQATLVEQYMAARWPSQPATPAEVLAYIMDQRDLKPSDMTTILGRGSAARVSEILAGKKAFSLPQIRRLHKEYGVPWAALIAEVA